MAWTLPDITSMAIEYDGHPAVLCMIRDVTERKQLQLRLVQSDRLASVGMLAAGIAHEINNTLEGMANWLSLARTELNRGEFRVAGEHLEKVKEGLDGAAGIVRQVLAHSDPAKATRVPVDLTTPLGEPLWAKTPSHDKADQTIEPGD